MWRSILTERGDLLRSDYPFLRFEAVESLMHPYGVPDDLWMKREEADQQKSMATAADMVDREEMVDELLIQPPVLIEAECQADRLRERMAPPTSGVRVSATARRVDFDGWDPGEPTEF